MATKATKEDLEAWVKEALVACGGRATLLNVAKEIWRKHQEDLEVSGDLFYTWQYDMRWAANKLRRKKVMKSFEMSPRSVWELA